MRAVDTTGVEPMSHPQDVSHRLRDDEVTETNRRGFSSELRADRSRLYLVPKVIE